MPVVTTVLRLTVPPAFVVRLASGLTVPTSASKSVRPVELATNVESPSVFPANVMLPLPVETVVLASRVVVPPTRKSLLVVL